jgi:g-D-glutamyl-meso-diaminopimelate peptidase
METLSIGSRGPDVKLVQSLLTKIGYDPGPVDGIYGDKTRQAVLEFQIDNRLPPDGVVGPLTWRLFDKFLIGYDTVTVRSGDTISNIAQRYYTTVNAILTANPSVDPMTLTPGQRITVPYGIDVVFTDIDYTYEIMERDLMGLKARYPFLQIASAGKSVLGKNLYYIRLGTGPRQVHYNGAHHALEWINAPVLMKFIENFCKAYSTGTPIRGFSAREIWNESSIFIIPMVNPDGVDLVLNGLDTRNPFYNSLTAQNRTGLPFSQVWQANIRGVDLNRNYPAGWELAKAQEAGLGITGPGPTRFGGPFPLSEPETQTMAAFTRAHDFRLVLSFHSQGRVIYWLYDDIIVPRAREIGDAFSDISGYTLSVTPQAAAYAGYKDWFIEEFRRPGYTIEVGIGRNPLPISQFNSIYNDVEGILLLAPLV